MKLSPKKLLAGLTTVVAIALSSVALTPPSAYANWWSGGERSGSCYIPNRQTNFNCQFGTYRPVNGARQIGGFYINPRHQFGTPGTIPIQFRVNGGGWNTRYLTLNATSGNYIDFGEGVRSFDYRFLRPQSEALGGGTSINFRFNYDLDR